MNKEPSLKISVDCYAGHRGEQTPRRLMFDGRTIEVSEVLDAWLAPDHRHFKISGADSTHYILLRNDLTSARCELTMFDRTGAFLMVNGRGSSWRKGRSLQLSVQQARKAAAWSAPF